MKISKEELEKLYIQDRKSYRELAQLFETSTSAITRLLKKHGIQPRPFSTKGERAWNRGRPWGLDTRLKLRKARLGKPLSPEHREKVIKTLSFGQFREENPAWKGGRHAVNGGYIYRRVNNHPNVQSNGYVAEHRLVMEEKVGRFLTRFEHVHHINKDKHDNSPENLELVNAQTHTLITALETRVKNLEKELASITKA